MTTTTAHSGLEDLAREAEELLPWIAEHRHHLHRYPELSFHEEKTGAYLREQIKAIGLDPSPPVRPDRHGFHVDLKSPTNPDRFILLRADFDALPIQEENDIEWKSTVPGVGHLCGHDTHAAMLLGAARLLAKRRDSLPISVRFIFQHAEEIAPGGARDFVDAGLTNDVIGCFGLHVSPRVPAGFFGLRSGEAWAAIGSFNATIRGHGGHAAMPHECRDPIPAASNAVLALQQLVSRRIPPMEPAVVTVSSIHAGTSFNVIPDEVKIGGTFRTFNLDRIPELEGAIAETIRDAARTWRCEAHVTATHSYPPVVNDERATQAAQVAIQRTFGLNQTVIMDRNMGGEDFAYFALAKPSSFACLGVQEDGEPFHSLHHCRFLPKDKYLWRGSAYLAALPFAAPQVLTPGE